MLYVCTMTLNIINLIDTVCLLLTFHNYFLVECDGLHDNISIKMDQSFEEVLYIT